ncbi:MAG: ABC transporter substrate-binding protein [Dehalococcoidales bacterium]|nr:ABC transporter substrate-binding protein [Dehalococcoidales bacterium]
MVKRVSSITWAVITILLLGALVFGCTKQTTTSNTTTTTTATATTSTTTTGVLPQYGGVLRLNDTHPPNPSNNIGWPAAPTSTGIATWGFPWVEPLLRENADGTYKPILAADYTIADDLTSITFTLRQGVKFHDGTDFNAASAKWNFDQYINNNTRGAANYFASVDTLDQYVIRVNLKQYNNTLIAFAGGTYMVSPTAYETYGEEGMMLHPVGTGPFKFSSYSQDVSITYTRFDDYWQEGKPYLNGIVVSFIMDPLTMSASFEAGELDAYGTNLSKIEYDLQQKGYPVVSMVSAYIALVGDSKNADSPFAKREVREALDYAIDKAGITAALGYGFSDPVYQFAPANSLGWVDGLDPRSYDPDKARQLLADAGYADGFDTTLYATPVLMGQDWGVAIQDDLAKVGIRATLKYDDPTFAAAFFGGWNNGLMATTIGGAGANFNAGLNWYLGPTSPFLASLDKTPEFLQLFEASINSKYEDPALEQAVAQYIYDTSMVNFLWTIRHGDVLKPYVHDSGLNSFGSWPYWTPEDCWMSAH